MALAEAAFKVAVARSTCHPARVEGAASRREFRGNPQDRAPATPPRGRGRGDRDPLRNPRVRTTRAQPRRTPGPAIRSLLGAVLLFAGAPAVAGDWPQIGGGPGRTPEAREAASPEGAAPAWRASLGGAAAAGCAVADGVLVAATRSGEVRAYDAANGTLRWRKALGGAPTTATPALAAGRAVVATGDGRILALALETGALLWERAFEGGARAAPVVSADTVVATLGFPSRRLVALDLRTGRTRWEVTLEQLAYASPAASQDVVVVGTDAGNYQARRLANGELLWQRAASGRVLLSSVLVEGDSVFVLPGGASARLQRLALDGGSGGDWTLDLPEPGRPTPSWSVVGWTATSSTPALLGDGSLACAVRFDALLDAEAPFGAPERFVSRERLYVVDPAGPRVRWYTDLAQLDAPTHAEVPDLGTLPPPLPLERGGVPWVGVASSLEASLRFFAARDGALVGEHREAGRWAEQGALALANGRLHAVRADGGLLALGLPSNRPPQAPSPLGSAGEIYLEASPELRWTAAADPDDASEAIAYEVRLDDDGEVLLDDEFAINTAPGQTTLRPPPLRSDVTYTLRVRARDPSGAYSPWSRPRTFSVSLVPEPPRNPRAFAQAEWVDLSWDPSPSDFVRATLLSWRALPDGDFGADLELRGANGTRVEGLRSGTRYAFRLRSVSRLGRVSAPVFLEVTAQPPVLLGGIAYAALEDALAAARAGDTIQLAAGRFLVTAPAVLPPGVTLRGESPHLTRVAGFGLHDVFALAPGSEPTRLESLAVFSGTRGVAVPAGARLELRNVVFYDLDTGLSVEAGAEAIAEHLTVVGAKRRGVFVAGQLQLGDSLFCRNRIGIERSPGAALTTRYVSVCDSEERNWLGAAPGDTDRAVHPTFRDADLGDYRIAAGSASVDAADPDESVGDEPSPNGGRANLGAFGTLVDAAPSGGSSGGGGCALASSGASSTHPGLATLLLLGILGSLGALRGRSTNRPGAAR
ncbi:MAG: hypothetical protein D6731_02905 [Planctomycetota bacterium]|nr:MAG: hypothetical protein D6731_02905 [Planctomycetota bacterium]